jgi:hypothetical protein
MSFQKLYINAISVFSLSVVLFIFNSCNKDNNDDYPIPDVYVNKTINIDLPSYAALQSIGGYVVIANEGYKGLIVYHDITDEFIALERACPYRPLDDCAVVTVESSGISIRCGHYDGSAWVPCCDSHFMMDGTLVSGPSKFSLKRYNVTRAGSMLSITN